MFGNLSSTVPVKTITSSFAMFCVLLIFWVFTADNYMIFVKKNQVVFMCLHRGASSDKISVKEFKCRWSP